MEKQNAFRSDEWFVDCPKCEELVELGDESQAQAHTEESNPVLCLCGEKFTVTWDSVN